MIPVGHVVHQLPRRVRIKVAEKKGDIAYFEGLVAALSQQPAIEEVTANPRAGSITLRYSGPLEARCASRTAGLFTPNRSSEWRSAGT